MAQGWGGERARKTLAVRTIGGHWLKQWTVGGEGRGEQARLEPNADIATGPIAAPSTDHGPCHHRTGALLAACHSAMTSPSALRPVLVSAQGIGLGSRGGGGVHRSEGGAATPGHGTRFTRPLASGAGGPPEASRARRGPDKSGCGEHG